MLGLLIPSCWLNSTLKSCECVYYKLKFVVKLSYSWALCLFFSSYALAHKLGPPRQQKGPYDILDLIIFFFYFLFFILLFFMGYNICFLMGDMFFFFLIEWVIWLLLYSTRKEFYFYFLFLLTH